MLRREDYEYMFSQSLKCLVPKTFQMDVLKGSTLDECKREAAIVALTRMVDVEFTFNDTQYITGPELLIERVQELK